MQQRPEPRHGRLVAAHARHPRLEFDILVHVLRGDDVEASLAEDLAPRGETEAVAMARVAQFLEGVIGLGPVLRVLGRQGGEDLLVGRDVVDDRKQAVRHQHAIRLGGEGRDIAEMMRGEAAGDEVEAHVGEGQVLGLGLDRLDIAEAARGGELLRLGEHGLGDVARGDLGDVWGECERGMAGAGGDIEHAPPLFRRHQLDEAARGFRPWRDRRGGVVGGCRPELFFARDAFAVSATNPTPCHCPA